MNIKTLRCCFSPRRIVERFVIDNTSHINKDAIKLALTYTSTAGSSTNCYHFLGKHSDIRSSHSLTQWTCFLEYSPKNNAREKEVIHTNISAAGLF